MDFQTPTQPRVNGQVSSTPLTGTPSEKPKTKKRTATLRLGTPQLIDAAEEADRVGKRAVNRKLEGNEAYYLEAFLRDLKRWANRTEPDMTVAQFATDAMRAGRCRALRRVIADRRTGALRLSLNRAQGKMTTQTRYESDSDDGAENTEPAARTNRVAQVLDMDIDPDEVCYTPPTKKVTEEESPSAPLFENPLDGIEAVLQPRVAPPTTQQAIPTSNQAVNTSSRVAPTLDMEVDPSDMIPVPRASAPDNGNSGVGCDGDDDEIEDYELEILREFEAAG